MVRRSNWYTRYLDGLDDSRRLYSEHKARFIRCLLNYNYPDYLIWTAGFEYGLVPRVEFRRDKRISMDWLCVEKYPLYIDWISALNGVSGDVLGKQEFKEAFNTPCGDKECFIRLQSMWEYVILHFNRYIMQYECIHGKQDCWKKNIFK